MRQKSQLVSFARSKYFKFKSRLERSIASGRFDELSQKKKNGLISRVEKFRNQLERLNISTRGTMVAGSVVAAATVPLAGNSQNIYLENTSGISTPSPNDIVAANLDMDEELEIILATSGGGFIAHWDGKDSYSGQLEGDIDKAIDEILVGDIDGDNDIDLIFSYSGDASYFYKAVNNGFGDFTTTAIGTTTITRDADIVDWDSDGDLDIVTASGNNNFEVLQNDGSGNFTDLGPIALNEDGVWSIEFADMDNDGDMDLLHVAYPFTVPYTSSVYLLENTTDGPGTPTFDIANPVIIQQQNYGSRYDGLVTFDFDGDGDLDIFYHHQSLPTGYVKRNNYIEGTPLDFTDIGVSYLESTGTIEDAVAGDFDNDGNDELILAAGTFNKLLDFNGSILSASGNNLGGEIGNVYGTFESIFVADVNNDGNLDLLATDPRSNQATIYHDDAAPEITGFLGNTIIDENSPLGTSVGVFTITDRQGDPITANLVGEDAGFFNFDQGTGELTINAELDWESKGSDILFAMEMSDGIKSRVQEAIIKINNLPESGNGTFDPDPVKLFATREVDVFEPGDYDMDGDTDMFLTSFDSPLYNSILQQNQGSFSDVPTTAFTNRQSAAAFIDSYGGLDLLVHDETLDELRVSRNNGGEFSSFSTLHTGIRQANKMITGDFDGDGLFEVAVQGEDLNGYDIVLTFEDDGSDLVLNQNLMISNGSTGLLDGLTGTFKEIAITDFDGDGFMDMLAVSVNGDDVVFAGGFDQGGGVYGFESSYTPVITQADGGETEVEVGDIDGDGSDDIAIMRWDNNVNYGLHVDIHINDGTGSFSLDQTIPLGGEFWGNIGLADIDGDGSLDLVTSNLKTVDLGGEFDISMSLETFTNDGSGNLTLSQSIHEAGGESFKMADVDGDDDLDLVLIGDLAAPTEDNLQLKVFRNVNVSPTAINPSSTSFDEHLPINTEVAVLNVDDLNVGDVHVISLITGDGTNDMHNSYFTINGNSLRLTKDVSFETTPTLNIYLSVNDGHQTFEQALTLNVNDVNMAPTGISLSSGSFDEGTSPGTVIATISAIDPNVGDSHTFDFATGDGTNDADNGSFVIDGNQLIVTDESSFESKPTYNIYLVAADIDNSVEQAFVINVNDINQAPTGISLSSSSFDEGTAPGSQVAVISAIDANVGDTHTFEFATGDGTNDADNGSFVIDGNSLVITEESSFENKSSYHIYLSATDTEGSANQAFILTVNDINQAPTGIQLSAISFAEGTPPGTTIATLSAVDPNMSDTHTFGFATGDGTNDADNGAFVIDGSNLIITEESNFETKPSYNIYLSVSDSEGSFEQAFLIGVNDVNQAPTAIALSNNILSEDDPAGTVIGTLTVTDPNAGDTHILGLATGDGSNDAHNGLFVINGNELILIGDVNFDTTPTLNILISANDGEVSYEEAFTLTVNDALGLEDEFANTLGIYPNPGHDRLEINLENDLRGPMEVRISDLAGRVIHQYESRKTESTWVQRIDMSSAEPGMYVVEVSLENRRFIQRWIKE